MSILTGPEIKRQIDLGRIQIDPYEPGNVNPNSIDLRLGDRLRVYRRPFALDSRKDNETEEITIKPKGFELLPHVLYLGHTLEHTDCGQFAPMLEGKSSIARLGISIHATAGVGDVGFRGQWTLEITVVHPVIVYPEMRIAQLLFHEVAGEIEPYKGRYQGQRGPVASRLWQGEQ